MIANTKASNMPSRNLKRHIVLPRYVRNLPVLLPPICAHLPRPSLSLSEKSLRPVILNVGRLVDIFLACLEKKPLFLVEKDGYPLTSSLLAFALAQVTFSPLDEPLVCTSPYSFLGLALPLTLSYGLVSPGLDHPPPLLGDGERDKDIEP